jgi:hypothetical protein
MEEGALIMPTALTTAPVAQHTQQSSGLTSRDDAAGASATADLPIETARAQLAEVSALISGWDGRHARPVTQVAVERAARLLAGLWVEAEGRPGRAWKSGVVLRPQVFALPDGGLQIEWHAGPIDLEVVVEPDGSAVVSSNGPTADLDCDIEVEANWAGKPPAPAVSALAELMNRVWRRSHPVDDIALGQVTGEQ